MPTISIYTDGACSGNGKSDATGGWGYIILGLKLFAIQGQGKEPSTTNQRMELQAAIEALKRIEKISFADSITLYTDSAYLSNCWKQNWWRTWISNGWRNSKKEPVANKDLWEQLVPWFDNVNFSIEKVKGHSGDKYNEIVDKLATGELQLK